MLGADQPDRRTGKERICRLTAAATSENRSLRSLVGHLFSVTRGYYAIISGRESSLQKQRTSWRWGQSSANASLNENSLLSGKIQGISADSAPETIQGSVFRTINQWVAAKFPTQWNREFFRENSEFPRRIRECRMSMIVGQCLLLAHSRLFELARRKSVVGGKADIAAMARWPP